ncbi:MAG: hypothetical protein K8F27_01545 [Sulfuricellaceae bacterium]|nr:hypothetical protein [Sulfuricellaceae bacterium]
MFVEILKHTPAWVFALFFALFALGYRQSKPRRLSPAGLFALPVAMLGYSLYGTWSSFGIGLGSLLPWGGGILGAALLGRLLTPPPASPATEDGKIAVAGSWLPLALMMAIFFSRYALAVVLARHGPLGAGSLAAGLASLWFGLLSGAFLARALNAWRGSGLPPSCTDRKDCSYNDS